MEIIKDKLTIFHWFFEFIWTYFFEWFKRFFCNLICFIIHQDSYVASLQEIKLFLILNWVFLNWDILQLLVFFYHLYFYIQFNYYSENYSLLLVYNTFFFMLKSIPSTSNYFIFNCFSFFFRSEMISYIFDYVFFFKT